MSFHVGQKVVCVDGSCRYGRRWHPECCPPSEGATYTVRDVGDNVEGGLGVKLFEALCVGVFDGALEQDAFFRASRFRPVVERKTDISIFTRMLTPNTREIENV